jgi:hypothetical protein
VFTQLLTQAIDLADITEDCTVADDAMSAAQIQAICHSRCVELQDITLDEVNNFNAVL